MSNKQFPSDSTIAQAALKQFEQLIHVRNSLLVMRKTWLSVDQRVDSADADLIAAFEALGGQYCRVIEEAELDPNSIYNVPQYGGGVKL